MVASQNGWFIMVLLIVSIYNIYIYTGWWLTYPSENYDGVRQWGWDDIPCMTWKIIQMFQTTNQYIYIYIVCYKSIIFKTRTETQPM